MSAAAAVGGWVAAAVAALVAAASTVALRRVLGSRMEAVARACHELRGPLTAARLGLSFGERRGELSADRLRAIETELSRATLALQDLAEAGRGGLRPGALERLDARELLEDRVRACAGLAAGAGTTLTISWDGPRAAIWGDRLRLAQALGNLIANAIEHGGDHVHARGRANGGLARMEISDDGPGLPAPLSELARRPRHGRGARGRGLAIVTEIARGHGGRVVSAPSPHGARIALELPCAGSDSGRRGHGTERRA